MVVLMFHHALLVLRVIRNLLKRDHTHCAIMRVEVEVFLRKEIKRLKGTETLSSEDAAEIDSIMALIGYNKSKRK